MLRLRAAKSLRVMARSAARDRILALMREHCDLIRAKEPGTRLGSDPEELHQMRAAVRRLRAILGAVRGMFDPQWVAGLRCRLYWLCTRLWGLRGLVFLRVYLGRVLLS